MTLKTSKPARGNGTGSGDTKAATAFIPEFSARTALDQSAFAAEMLARRFGLAPSTALANVEAFGWGGAR